MPAPVYDEWVTRARTLLCVVLALLLSTLGIGPARADEVPSGRVQLTVVTPTVLDAEHPGTGLTLRGTFTNTTGVPLYWVDAEVWHRSGLTTFDDVDAAIDSHATAPTGVRHRPGASLATSTPLAPGASTPFTLRVPLAALDLADDQVATVVGVDVRAATSATGTRETVGRERALLPHASQPFRLTDLVFLTARAGTRPGSRAVTDELAEQIVGPLTERLAESETPGVTTVIDPAVYRAATLLAADERNPSPASAEFVRRVDALRDAGRLWRTPHGNPNLARMPDRLRAQASTWADELAPEALADVPTVARPPAADVEPPGFDKRVVTSATSRGLRCFLLGAPPVASLVGAFPAPRPTDASAPGNAPWAPDQGPWRTVDRLLADVERQEPARRELTSGPDGKERTDLRPLLLAAYGADFASEDDARTWLDTVPEVGFDPDRITFRASPSFVMGERTSEFPTTITNPTDLPIWVRVVFTSDNPQRITVPDTDVVRVGPGEAQTLRVAPAATANGVSTVHARLVGIDGTPVGPSTSIEVTATEFGRVGWIIIIVSGAVVLGGTVWRIRTVQREHSEEASESGQ